MFSCSYAHNSSFLKNEYSETEGFDNSFDDQIELVPVPVASGLKQTSSSTQTVVPQINPTAPPVQQVVNPVFPPQIPTSQTPKKVKSNCVVKSLSMLQSVWQKSLGFGGYKIFTKGQAQIANNLKKKGEEELIASVRSFKNVDRQQRNQVKEYMSLPENMRNAQVKSVTESRIVLIKQTFQKFAEILKLSGMPLSLQRAVQYKLRELQDSKEIVKFIKARRLLLDLGKLIVRPKRVKKPVPKPAPKPRAAPKKPTPKPKPKKSPAPKPKPKPKKSPPKKSAAPKPAPKKVKPAAKPKILPPSVVLKNSITKMATKYLESLEVIKFLIIMERNFFLRKFSMVDI